MYKLKEKIDTLNEFTSTNYFIDCTYKEDIRPLIQSSLDRFYDLFDEWKKESKKDNSDKIDDLESELHSIESDIKSEFQSIYDTCEIGYHEALELYDRFGTDIDDVLEFPLSEYASCNKSMTLDQLIESVITEAYTHALFFIYDFMD